ncbi:hypothetical protein BDP55DRAFT_225717 [Colletotrichum godetiae]|uniref:Uncharacterized protein n=1 Tax=Colletotrichum godetiae TaxID=1209918 RepID=A0AAJ0AGH5_9PEZI|nr:uncharacterized protein BDP55DRAFT_225717 [Colletotrichum godetiae]KAK1673474.1 hypothetical protein BDP55DRAFT_225717 [Colletotrichum godetiae]
MSEPRAPVRPLSSLLASGTPGAAASQRCYRSGQASCNVDFLKPRKRRRIRKGFFFLDLGTGRPTAQRQRSSETFRVQRSPKSQLHPDSPSGRCCMALIYTATQAAGFCQTPPNKVPTPGFWVLSSDESKLTCRVRLKLSGRYGLWRGCVINWSEETATSRPRDRPRFEVDIACRPATPRCPSARGSSINTSERGAGFFETQPCRSYLSPWPTD